MKKISTVFLALVIISGCSFKMAGMKEVKEPFSGSKYASNGRWFRGTGSGESMNLETSKDKAMLSAKQRLASGVQTLPPSFILLCFHFNICLTSLS